MRGRALICAASLVAAMVFAGCGSQVCEPRATRACDCPESGMGIQACDAEGEAWGECRCATRPAVEKAPPTPPPARAAEATRSKASTPAEPPAKAVDGFTKVPAGDVDQAQKTLAETIASKTLTAWCAGQFNPLGDEFSPEVQAKLPPPAQQAGTAQMKGLFGDYQSMEFAEAWQRADLRVYRFKGTFAKSRPEVRLTFDGQGKVAGLWVRPWHDGLMSPEQEAAAAARSQFSRIPDGEVDGAQKTFAQGVAASTLTAWTAGQFNPLGEEFTPEVRGKLPPPAQQVAAAQTKQVFGDFQSLEFVEAHNGPDMRVYRFRGTFSKSRPEVRVTLNNDGKVAGFWCRPWADGLQ